MPTLPDHTRPTDQAGPETPAPPLILGFEEWVALPALGLPAIKAKIDTGARTSALHAARIEPFGSPDKPMVRFAVHPVPNREGIEIVATAPLVDQRDVTSSNGVRERRYVIRTDLEVGGRRWPIEITLTNRATMTYRMLLGRQALDQNVLIDPSSALRQPRLSYRLYGSRAAVNPARTPLTWALVGRTLTGPTARLLSRLIAERGGHCLMVDLAVTELIEGPDGPELHVDGVPIERPDVALTAAHALRRGFDLAVWRHLEARGTVLVTPARALDVAVAPKAAAERLANMGLLVSKRMRQSRGGSNQPDEGQAPALTVLVLSGQAVAQRGEAAGAAPEIASKVELLAVQAADALGLGLAAVTFETDTGAPRILRVEPSPSLTAFGGKGAATARLLLDQLDAHARHR